MSMNTHDDALRTKILQRMADLLAEHNVECLAVEQVPVLSITTVLPRASQQESLSLIETALIDEFPSVQFDFSTRWGT